MIYILSGICIFYNALYFIHCIRTGVIKAAVGAAVMASTVAAGGAMLMLLSR